MRICPLSNSALGWLQCCCQNLTPLPEDTALARQECGSTAISPECHMQLLRTSTQKYHGKLHTCTTTTAKPVCTQSFLRRRQFQLSIQSHASRSHYFQTRPISLINQLTCRVQTGHKAQLACWKSIRLEKIQRHMNGTGYLPRCVFQTLQAVFFLLTVFSPQIKSCY